MSSGLTSKRGRVLIATLFLPESVSFDEALTPQGQPSPSLSADRDSLPLSSSITKDSAASTTSDSYFGISTPDNVPKNLTFPSNSLQANTTSSEFAKLNTDAGLTSSTYSGRPLSPIIGSQPSSPTVDRNVSLQSNALGLQSLLQPAVALLQSAESGSKHSATRPSLGGRGVSIVEHLLTKGTGTSAAAAPRPTPATLDLGRNPFEAAAAAGLAAAPAPTPTPSLQASIAMKRPLANRLLSEGHSTSNLSIPRGANMSQLKRLLDNSEDIAGNMSHSHTRNISETQASILPTAGADSPTSGHSSIISITGSDTTPLTLRKRSASITKSGQQGGPGTSRTFSRSGRRDSHRRRSSTTSALHPDLTLSAFSQNTRNRSGGSYSTLPYFCLESNPHGNGGLQNAIRSVADAHIRISSDPVPTGLPHLKSESNQAASAAASEVVKDDKPDRATHDQTLPAIGGSVTDYRWIGTIGCGISDFEEPLRAAVEKRYGDEKRSAVVWVEDDVLEPAYDNFCKQILWPTFHYQVHDVHKTKAYQSPAWKDYVAMNQAFADKIVEVYRKGDLIWVNDYHLMLVPDMLRHKLPDATIGFFLHIAFPSSEIFRCLANRTQLLEGILGADLIGFQTYNLSRHFRQTCQRLLSVEATPRGIQLQNGFAKVGVFPIGIDVKALHERKREAEVVEWVDILRERYAGMRILMSRDKLDEIKGVRQKLVAFEHYLERHPDAVGKVVLIQVAMATAEENEKQGDVMDLVSRVNARFSTFSYQPVVFLHQDVSFSQYLALLIVAEVFINSSLREGMNLTSHEYIICQEDQCGPLLLSEFTGSYSRAGFQRCIPINPWDKRNFACAIAEALEMPKEERISRWRDLERHVWSQTAQHWCSSFIDALQREVHDAKSRPLASPSWNQMAMLPTFDPQIADSHYQAATHRLILLDLEGTLITERVDCRKQDLRKTMQLSGRLAHALQSLSNDPKNTVYLMSGYSVADVAALAADFPDIGFISENGCFLSMPNRKSTNERTWHKLVDGTHVSWRQPVLNALSYYTERTPGSYIDDRGVSIVWRYANTGDAESQKGAETDPQDDQRPRLINGQGNEAYHWARRQATEVQNHIMDSLGERFGLRLHPGATSFLILPRSAGRAMAVAHILQRDDFAEEELPVPPRPEPIRPPFSHNMSQLDLLDEDAADDSVDTLLHDHPADSESGFNQPKASKTVYRLTSESGPKPPQLDKLTASRRLLAQYDYVLAMSEDQRLLLWLEEMSVDKVVTVSVGGKKRGARWQLQNSEEVQRALEELSCSTK